MKIFPLKLIIVTHVMASTGAGRFGKVYTAVNNNTGELMAMKVLPLQPNDHRSMQRMADEFHIFEGISHPHLVKCYGIEIHNVSMSTSEVSSCCVHSIITDDDR